MSRRTHRVGDQAAGASWRDFLQRAVEGPHDVVHAAALACKQGPKSLHQAQVEIHGQQTLT
jgi:hypothetical protein